MKKVMILLLLLLPLLSGCWDQLPLRNLNLVDIAGMDINEDNGDVEVDYVVTKLKSAGQGTGDPTSLTTKLKAPSLVEAIGQTQYTDQAPILGISTGVYLLSEKFASRDPISEFEFLLHAPYASISTPLVIFEGDMATFLEKEPVKNPKFTKDFSEFIKALNNNILPNVSMMQFIQSKEDQLTDTALPVIKQSKSGVELAGALLFHKGTSSEIKLSKEQVLILRLLQGKAEGRQRFTGHLAEGNKDQASNGQLQQEDYGFSVRKGNSKIVVSSKKNNIQNVKIVVHLNINVFKLNKDFHDLKSDYVNRMEKELNHQLEKMATSTIETLQNANCDILEIGIQIKAYHPKIWKSLNWDKDFQKIAIEPDFDVQILNTDAE